MLRIEMAEYMLVSAPGEPTPERTWGLINEKTNSLSINNKFSIPELKVSLDGPEFCKKKVRYHYSSLHSVSRRDYAKSISKMIGKGYGVG